MSSTGFPRFRLPRFPLAVGLALAAAENAAAAEAVTVPVVTAAPRVPAAADAGEAVQTLFMGADVVILKDRDFHPVQRIEGGHYVIEVKGRPVRVPLDAKTVRLKVEPSLKLSSVSANVDRLRTVRTYTPGNNPNKKALAEASRASGAAAVADVAMDQYVAAAGTAQNANLNAIDPSQAIGDIGRQVFQAGSDLQIAKAQTQAAGEAVEGAAGLPEETFDAVDVEFELSSETPLAEPYLVVVSRYRFRGAADGPERSQIHAQALEPVDRRPRRISLRQTGFPRGFTLEEVQIHLYDHGEEVASNVAPNRVPLGREEAFQYLLMDYVATHKGETLPAAAAVGQLAPEVRQQIPSELLDHVFHVKVGKDGRVIEAYTDAACTTRVADRYVVLALKRVLFKPALEKGRPVEGVARLKLSHLPQ